MQDGFGVAARAACESEEDESPSVWGLSAWTGIPCLLECRRPTASVPAPIAKGLGSGESGFRLRKNFPHTAGVGLCGMHRILIC